MRSNSCVTSFRGCCGVGLDFCLNSWEKCIIYLHYFANYFNAIFITGLNNKPKIFVMEEEGICLVSSRTPKHSQVPLVLLQKFISEWIAPNSLLSLSSLPFPLPILNFQQRIEPLLSLRPLVNYNSLQQPHVLPWTLLQSTGGWQQPPSVPPAASGPRAGLCLCLDMFQGSSAQKQTGDLQPLRWYHQRI